MIIWGNRLRPVGSSSACLPALPSVFPWQPCREASTVVYIESEQKGGHHVWTPRVRVRRAARIPPAASLSWDPALQLSLTLSPSSPRSWPHG